MNGLVGSWHVVLANALMKDREGGGVPEPVDELEVTVVFIVPDARLSSDIATAFKVAKSLSRKPCDKGGFRPD